MAKLIWYRNNLRTTDSAPLLAACEDEENVHACFLFSTSQWQRHGWGPNRIEYIRRSAVALAKQLQQLHIPLHIFQTPTFDKAPGVIRALAQELGCSEVHWSREYETNELIRDRETRELLERSGITAVEHDDDVVVAPDALWTRTKNPFRVFTPYKRAWLKALDNRLINTDRLRPRPRNIDPVALPEVPNVLQGFEDFVQQDNWPVGEEQALERLDAFIKHSGFAYADNRDIPSIEGTSSLSPCLAAGVLSPRTCVLAALQEAQKNPQNSPGLDTWISELAWRDFYRAVVFHFPHICQGKPFKIETESVVWRDDQEGFDAWCSGQTGYPIVDAAMRALVSTGWMHNRLRMVTAQFLSKHLLIDWRKGEAFFAHHLVDADFASNNGGWQWSASTGTDAVPYFRIFNPTTQGKRFDTDGSFIRRWIPELALISAPEIHEPGLLPMSPHGPLGYPRPIVDQAYGRARAIAAFADASSKLEPKDPASPVSMTGSGPASI